MTDLLAESTAVENSHLVAFDGSFLVSEAPTAPAKGEARGKEARAALELVIDELDELQRMLYADNSYSLLLIFQAMDAAGKDSTIRKVLTGVDPAGCQVFSFKQPSSLELDHDFLWRSAIRLPERGRIGVFNRSYYEEVLIARVHPRLLKSQRLPSQRSTTSGSLEQLWQERLESIRDHELHLARNGTVVLKFWLNVSKEEQRQRFLSRLEEPEKHWKFNVADVEEREHWEDYMHAYEVALNETSRPWAPWYAIPADSKSYMSLQVATILRDTLSSLGIAYPRPRDEEREMFSKMRELLKE